MTLLAEGTALPDVTWQRASIFPKKVSPTSGFIIQADNRRDPRLQPSCSTKLYTVHEPIWSSGSPLPAVLACALRRLRASCLGVNCCCSSAPPLNPPKPTPFAKTEKHFPDASMCTCVGGWGAGDYENFKGRYDILAF